MWELFKVTFDSDLRRMLENRQMRKQVTIISLETLLKFKIPIWSKDLSPNLILGIMFCMEATGMTVVELRDEEYWLSFESLFMCLDSLNAACLFEFYSYHNVWQGY